jgi:hypothetical protein
MENSTSKYRIDVYIGSDNNSRKINDSYLEKVKNWANEAFPQGYTILKGEGYYNGISEDSILLFSFLEYDKQIQNSLQRLKDELKQESILFVKSNVDYEVA